MKVVEHNGKKVGRKRGHKTHGPTKRSVANCRCGDLKDETTKKKRRSMWRKLKPNVSGLMCPRNANG